MRAMSERIEGRAVGVIVAAGSSRRMDGVDKVFTTLAGRPLLAWTLAAFKKCEAIDGIVLVASASGIDRMGAFVREWRMPKIEAIVGGGATRQESVRAGIEAATDAVIVGIHDGARPLVTPELIARGVEEAREHRAVVCAVPARHTVRQVDGDRVVRGTLDREGVWLSQTAQVFARELLLEAHRRAEATATDDAALVEALGHEVRVYEGDPSNLKVTTAMDLVAAEALLRARFEG